MSSGYSSRMCEEKYDLSLENKVIMSYDIVSGNLTCSLGIRFFVT